MSSLRSPLPRAPRQSWSWVGVWDLADARRLARYWILASAMAHRRIDDDDLELYALHRLADAASVEDCRERLADWGGYIRAMREAMRRAALNQR